MAELSESVYQKMSSHKPMGLVIQLFVCKIVIILLFISFNMCLDAQKNRIISFGSQFYLLIV